MGRYRLLLSAAALLVAAMLVATFLLDRHYKALPIQVPEELEPGLAFYGADVPALWRNAAASPAGVILRDDFAMPIEEAALAIRKATGIRPTPLRWQVWLGASAWLHWDGVRTVVALRPGLLLRSLCRLQDMRHPEGGGAQLMGWHAHWREGMIFLSDDPQWRSAVLRRLDVALTNPGQTVHMACRVSDGSLRYELEIDIAEDWAVAGRIHLPEAGQFAGTELQPLGLDWPGEPVLHLGATGPAPVALWNRLLLDSFHCYDSAPTLANIVRCALDAAGPVGSLTAMSRSLSDDWQRAALAWQFQAWPLQPFQGKDMGALALYDLDLEDLYAVPVLAKVGQLHPGVAPLSARDWPPQFMYIPYAWDDLEGYRIPLLGQRLEWCQGQAGAMRYGASQEPLMYDLARKAPEFSGAEALLTLQLHWRALSRRSQTAAHRLVEARFFPDYTAMEFDRAYGGMLRGMARLGELEARLLPHDEDPGLLVLTGTLFANAEIEP